ITSHPDLSGNVLDGYDFVSDDATLNAPRVNGADPVSFDGDYVDNWKYGANGWDANPTDPGDWRSVAPLRDSSWHGT
ncbi:hypothetical protein, partial [Streptococcus pneumoniae]|uniref:hypothetical protein n=1 Tax=Streptococcus pneumoniae TaxID=1313 RepID=UPI001E55F16D